MPIIEIQSLTKIYPSRGNDVVALNNLSLSIEDGCIFGLLGPNGAGKTTLIKILLSIIFPSKGNIRIFGRDIINNNLYKKEIGYLPENHKFHPFFTGRDVLVNFGILNNTPKNILNKKIDELLDIVHLSQWQNAKVKTYSKGMLQRLGLAQALLNNPDIIFLDEPTDGVDPIGRVEIRDILLKLKNEGKTIFINSHLLSEVEVVCDRVAILNRGVLIKEGNIEDLTNQSSKYNLVTEKPITQAILNSISNNKVIRNNDYNYFINTKDIFELNAIIDQLRLSDVLIKSLSYEKESLESYFVNILKGKEN